MKTELSTFLAVFFVCMLFGLAYGSEDVEDFFSLTPAELAAIPVTIATGTPKPVFQAAGVTSVVTAEQIKAMGATELHEVLKTVPGLHVGLQTGSYDYKYTFRGIGNDTNSQVLFLLDGTRITTPFRGTLTTGLELPIEAIERVEVIRGPGSALYGADAFAGVINVITKKAKDIGGTHIGVRAGNWETASAWAQHGSQWQGWDVAASLQYQHTAGDPDRTVQADTQTLFDRAFGTQASLAPGPLNTHFETLNGHLNLQRKHWDLRFWAFNLMDAGTRAGAAGALDPQGRVGNEAYLGDVRYTTEDDLGDWGLFAHASFLHTGLDAHNISAYPNNTRLPIGADGNIALNSNNLVLFPDGVKNNIGRIQNVPSLDLGANYQGFKNHLLLFSAGFRYEEITASEHKNYGPGVIDGSQRIVYGDLTDVTDTPYIYLPDTHRTVWSTVIQDEWGFAQDWLLTTGVRYDDYSDFGGTVNPRAALVWDINDRTTSKLLYGRAFRAPSFSEQGNQNNPVLIGNRNLKPETIDTYEWALDYRPTRSLRTALNIYYYQINDLILPVPDADQLTSTFQNGREKDGYGTEFEWNWRWHEHWNLAGNYAWQNAVNTVTNERVTGVPEHRLFTALTWCFLPQWQLQPQINWVGGRTRIAGDNRPLADYETVDLTLRGKKLFGQINVAASLRNMFDADAREPVSLQLPENLPLAGRSFYFEASVDF